MKGFVSILKLICLNFIITNLRKAMAYENISVSRGTLGPRRFNFINGNKTWLGALNFCKNIGYSTLIWSDTSLDEFIILKQSLIDQTGSADVTFWTGFLKHHEFFTNPPHWFIEENCTNIDHVDYNIHVSSGVDQCVVAVMTSNTIELRMESCSRTYPYVCYTKEDLPLMVEIKDKDVDFSTDMIFDHIIQSPYDLPKCTSVCSNTRQCIAISVYTDQNKCIGILHQKETIFSLPIIDGLGTNTLMVKQGDFVLISDETNMSMTDGDLTELPCGQENSQLQTITSSASEIHPMSNLYTSEVMGDISSTSSASHDSKNIMSTIDDVSISPVLVTVTTASEKFTTNVESSGYYLTTYLTGDISPMSVTSIEGITNSTNTTTINIYSSETFPTSIVEPSSYLKLTSQQTLYSSLTEPAISMSKPIETSSQILHTSILTTTPTVYFESFSVTKSYSSSDNYILQWSSASVSDSYPLLLPSKTSFSIEFDSFLLGSEIYISSMHESSTVLNETISDTFSKCICRCSTEPNRYEKNISKGYSDVGVIERKLLSSYRRKLTSAHDQRISSRAIGWCGAGFLIGSILFIVFLDMSPTRYIYVLRTT